jgi:hypothetical protein
MLIAQFLIIQLLVLLKREKTGLVLDVLTRAAPWITPSNSLAKFHRATHEELQCPGGSRRTKHCSVMACLARVSVSWLVVWLCDCSFCVLVVSLSLKGPRRPRDGSRTSQWRQQRGPHLGPQMLLLHPTNGTSPFPLQWWTTTRRRQQRRRRGSVPPRPHTRRRQLQRPTLGGASPQPTRLVPSTCTAQVRRTAWRATCRQPAHNRRASRLLRWVATSRLVSIRGYCLTNGCTGFICEDGSDRLFYLTVS